MIDKLTSQTPSWTSRPTAREAANDSRSAQRAETAQSVAPPQRLVADDPEEAIDADFDFDAANKVAAATLQRDQQQMKLAEMADQRNPPPVTYASMIAAYKEFQ